MTPTRGYEESFVGCQLSVVGCRLILVAAVGSCAKRGFSTDNRQPATDNRLRVVIPRNSTQSTCEFHSSYGGRYLYCRRRIGIGAATLWLSMTTTGRAALVVCLLFGSNLRAAQSDD